MTTYYPISLAPAQYLTSSGTLASGYVLKAYAAGTSTPISMATDYTGGTLVSTVTLNASGYPSVSGNIIIPHIAENYKIALYQTQAAADANAGAIFNPDNIQVSQNANAARYLNYAVDTGSANTYVVAPSPAISSYTTGDVITIIPSNANTGASTIAVNGLSAKNIKLPDGNNPAANALLTTGTYELMYNGTNFVLMNGSVSTSVAAITSGTISGVAITSLSADLLTADGGTGASSFTDGGVLIGNGGGIIQATTAGTAGQVLTSNGAGVDPTFQANAAASAGLTVIASGSFGAVTLLDITSIPQTYRGLVLYITGASNTVSTRALQIKLNAGNGLGVDQPAVHQVAGTTITSVNSLSGLCTDVTQVAGNTACAIIEFPSYQSGPIKRFSGTQIAAATAGTDWVTGTKTSMFGVLLDSGGVPVTGGIIGIRITWDNVGSGVFDAGTYALYGVN